MSSTPSKKTDLMELMPQLDAGVLVQRIERALSNCAASSVDLNRKSKVSLELSLSRIGKGAQVMMDCTVSYKCPTDRGEVTEKETTSIPLCVGRGGRLTLFSEDQDDWVNQGGRQPQSHLREV